MSAPDNGENEITDFDRYVADQVAGMYPDGMEPDYEWSAQTRREWESVMMYVQVHGVSFVAATGLVQAANTEKGATEKARLTPVIAHAIAELRRVAWSNADDRMVMEAAMALFTAVNDEWMKHDTEDDV